MKKTIILHMLFLGLMASTPSFATIDQEALDEAYEIATHECNQLPQDNSTCLKGIGFFKNGMNPYLKTLKSFTYGDLLKVYDNALQACKSEGFCIFGPNVLFVELKDDVPQNK